ncbi:MAG: ABC transporter permease [Saprospiraceae bacterium]|jgi:phospholipid/cholesterol/gamma-HCH transport system permease protein|nr:ABC transporter permease [Saprospiraceae bacterium]MBK7358596.1 ABC transporter permease [Saprospiraceae bacterium]MBK7737958.1 ABC transporter permease [Saprospiraceae bacterium]MBK7913463.1 ABC transporter permease [Saprospiraceae bacterium]
MFSAVYHFGRYIQWLGQAFHKPERYSMYWKETLRQMNSIGIGSVVIVGIISIFIGAVTAVQFAYQMGDSLIPRYYVGYIVRDMTIIELAPTFSCMLLAGKVGSNLAAELGGMRQKEHIDAMEIMGVNTASYLLQPKVIAALIVIPMLVCIGAFISIIGGYLAVVPTNWFSHAEYIRGLRSFFVPYNVWMMFVKAIVFAFILTTVPCYQGYFVKGGSIELGDASTRAVVYSNILILLSDYIIAMLMTS